MAANGSFNLTVWSCSSPPATNAYVNRVTVHSSDPSVAWIEGGDPLTMTSGSGSATIHGYGPGHATIYLTGIGQTNVLWSMNLIVLDVSFGAMPVYYRLCGTGLSAVSPPNADIGVSLGPPDVFGHLEVTWNGTEICNQGGVMGGWSAPAGYYGSGGFHADWTVGGVTVSADSSAGASTVHAAISASNDRVLKDGTTVSAGLSSPESGIPCTGTFTVVWSNPDPMKTVKLDGNDSGVSWSNAPATLTVTTNGAWNPGDSITLTLQHSMCTCMPQVVLFRPTVIIAPTSAVTYAGGTNVSFTAAGNSPGGFDWQLEPPSLQNGASISAGGTSAVVSPGSLGTSYVVRASAYRDATVSASGVLDVYKLAITPVETNLHVDMAGTVELQVTGDSYRGSSGLTWDTPAGLWANGAGTTYTITPSLSTPNCYTVTVSALALPECTAAAVVNVLNVDIEQTLGNVNGNTSTNCALNLTSASYFTDSGVVWTNSPVGISNIVTSSDYRTYSFSPSNSTPGSYTIAASASAMSSCSDAATVNVCRVELIPESVSSRWTDPDNVTITLTNSYFGTAGVVWSGTNGLAVVSAGTDGLVLTPGSSTPADYTITAAVNGLSECCDTNIVKIYRVDIEQAVTNAWWQQTSATLNLASGCNYGSGVTWYSVPVGISGTGTVITLNPSALSPTTYVVRAYADEMTNCYDTCTVRVIEIDIQQTSLDASCSMTNADVDLTTDSYWGPAGVVWTNEPAGLSNIVIAGDYRTYSFNPSTSTPGSYTVKAWAADLTNYCDAATANVFRVELAPHSADVCAHTPGSETIAFTNSYLGTGGITWSGTNGLHIVSADSYGLVFTPSNSVPSNYVVTAMVNDYTSCTDTTTVNVYRVELIPPLTNVCVHMSTNVTIAFTDGYLGVGGVTWSGTNGLLIVSADEDNGLVFTPTNSLPSNYVVTVTINDYTSCSSVATINVVKAEVTNLKFNWDTGSSASDAINIRQDYSTSYDISNGEWVNGGTNIPACYTTNKAVTIKARLTVQPASITSADIWAVSTDSGGSLGDVVKTNVTFVSGMASDVVFLVSGTTPNCIQKTTNDVWQWRMENVNGTGSSAWDLNTSGVHTVYTILNEPVAPWDNAWTGGNNASNAWGSVLDFVCLASAWAGGTTTIPDAAARVTQQIYNSGRFAYDFAGGGDCNYTEADGFNLTKWMERINGGTGKGSPVNCWDCANGVVSMCNVLGCDMWNQWMGSASGFACNEIRAIKDNAWGRPFGWGFGYHRVGWRGPVTNSSTVFDACLKVDSDGNPTGTGNHNSELIPTNVTFWTGSGAFDDYKQMLVDTNSYADCNVSDSPGVPQNPGRRRDPIK